MKEKSYNEFYRSDLFDKIQHSKKIISQVRDPKLIVDSIPKSNLSIKNIIDIYNKEKGNSNFNIYKFFNSHFEIPSLKTKKDNNKNLNFEDYCKYIIENSNHREKNEGSFLDTGYIQNVPGSRFQELYYWDSYFIALGFIAIKRFDLFENILTNFIFFIEKYGFIPNGARTYYLSRSQPPFFVFLLDLLEGFKGINAATKYTKYLELEYNFWMKGKDFISNSNKASEHVIKMPNNMILNRYWDQLNEPRPESFLKDLNLAKKCSQNKEFYRNIRAAAESGFDFSSRWFKKVNDFCSICTLEIIPVELNCILFYIEETLAKYYSYLKNDKKRKHFEDLKDNRKEAINYWCWSQKHNFFMDCNWDSSYKTNKIEHSNVKNVGCNMSMFTNIASEKQAALIKNQIENNFFIKNIKKTFGGIASTLTNSRLCHQWDKSNAWPPIQYITIMGLKNYKYFELAEKIKTYWLNYVIYIYTKEKKLFEKYNLTDFNSQAKGGEYKVQDGFGWTAGVCLSLLKN